MANPGPAGGAVPANLQAVMDGLRLLFYLPAGNLAVAGDQLFTKMFQGLTWDPQYVTSTYNSGAYSGPCTGAIYPLPNKGGTGLIPSTTSYAGLTGPLTHINCTIQATTTTFTTTPFLNMTSLNALAFLADFRIYGFCYD